MKNQGWGVISLEGSRGTPLNYNLYIIVAFFLPCVRGDFNQGLPALIGAFV
jgi:hypothetical protein